jgi:hypothetical protein
MAFPHSATLMMYQKNKKLSDICSIETLKGKRCFILGGGPSIKALQFSWLKGEFTIGINRSYEVFPTDILYCMDHDFYVRITQHMMDKYDPKSGAYNKFMTFPGRKVFLAIGFPFKYDDSVFVVNRIYQEECNLTDINRGIWAGNNSGAGAIMLAALLGCRDIYLLGYDMKATEKTHFHSGYPKQTVDEYRLKIEKFKKDLFKISTSLRMNDVNVTNCYINSPDETGLNCFPIKKLGDILWPSGNVSSENHAKSLGIS